VPGPGPPVRPGRSLVPADMSSGEVALYVLALLSSCQKPESVTALGQTVDLLQVLQQKTDEEMASLGTPGRGGRIRGAW